ncbi:hypothetical protein IQ244_23665 [Nostoc sp. LEGE 06077]|uniref:hypothetical protein n=1 Tax=Nostoc sp. LEGE 06077 TaxID=915325 RepID=UPI0018814E34|nr:hypothetical protein [Nostoc sp. LEGE 06077]MBE9209440.1 hypothetical protein [Nostoc sp. LEGE 06077]
MDIQSILSLAIQVIFMSFVSLVFVDFANGLFWLPYSYSAIAPVATSHQVIAAATPHTVPAPKPQFAQLPDPWELTDLSPSAIQQEPVVLEFPTLRLLPPAASIIQTEAKASTSIETSQPKSTKTRKTNKPKTAVTPRKSRKKSAA